MKKDDLKVSKSGILGSRLFALLINGFALVFCMNLLRLKETIGMLLAIAVFTWVIGRKETFHFWIDMTVSFRGICIFVSAVCLLSTVIILLLTIEDPITNNPPIIYRIISVIVLLIVDTIRIPANGPMVHFASRNFEKGKRKND